MRYPTLIWPGRARHVGNERDEGQGLGLPDLGSGSQKPYPQQNHRSASSTSTTMFTRISPALISSEPLRTFDIPLCMAAYKSST